MTATFNQPPLWRVALGLLIAPGIGALAGAALLGDWSVGGLVFLFRILATGGYLSAALLGVPLYFVARRFLRPRFLTICIAGVVVATIPFLLVTLGEGAFALQILAPLGALGGAVFWLIVHGCRNAASSSYALLVLALTATLAVTTAIAWIPSSPWNPSRLLSREQAEAIARERIAGYCRDGDQSMCGPMVIRNAGRSDGGRLWSIDFELSNRPDTRYFIIVHDNGGAEVSKMAK